MAGDQISYRPTVFKLKGEQHQFVKVRVNSARTGLAPLIALADGYRISPVFLDVGFRGQLSTREGSLTYHNPTTRTINITDDSGKPFPLDSHVWMDLQTASEI